MQPNTPAQQGGYYPPPPPSNNRPHYAPASTYHHHPSGPPQMMRSPYPVSGGGYHTYPNADSTMHSGFGGSENYGPSDMNGGGGGNLRAHPGAYRGRGYMGGLGSYPPPPPRHYGPPRAGRPEDAFQQSHGNDPVLHTGSPAYRNGNHTPLPSPLINQLAPPRPLPPVTFIQTQDELLEACTALTKCRVVSIEPHLSKSVSGEVSLLAICPDDDSCVYVIDVPKIQRVYVYKYLHPVLSDSEITTLVYNIDHVGPALIQRLGFSFARLVDLQSLALAVEWVMYGVNRLHNLDTAVENVLQMTAKPSHIAKIEKEVLTDGNSDVWDERPVRETLCEYAAYAVIHYFHLFRALRSKEREAEPMSMRIKEHRYNAVANRSNDNDIFGTNEGDTNQKDEVAVETLKELLGDPGVCPSCKKGGHTPTECHQTQQQQQASSGGPPAQFGTPVPHGHSGNASYHSAHYNAPPHPQNRSSGIPNEYGRNDRAATGADGYNNHNPYNARGGMPPVREGGNQYPPSYGRGGYRSSYPPRNDTGTFNGPPGMYKPSGAYHPTNRSDDVYGGPAQRRGGGPMDYNNRSPYHPNAGNAGSNPVRHNVVCEACNKPGHTAETCFQLKPDLMQSHPVVCSHCGMPGHREPRCFDKYPHLRQERSSGNPMEMGRGGGPSSRGPNIYQCTHCGRMGHTVDRCHQLYPELRKRLQRGDGEDAFGGSGSGSSGSNRDNNSQQQHMAPSFASSDGDESMSTKRRYY